MLKSLIDTIKNFDMKVKKIMMNGLRFSLIVALLGTLILTYYISIHSNLVYYIGIEVIHLSISFAVSFFASALVIDKVKKDLT